MTDTQKQFREIVKGINYLRRISSMVEQHKHCIYCGALVDGGPNICQSPDNVGPADSAGYNHHVYLVGVTARGKQPALATARAELEEKDNDL